MFPIKRCVAIVISSRRREICSSYVAENTRSLALLEMTNMGVSCIATQSPKGDDFSQRTARTLSELNPAVSQ
jgi:hypothetical protein